MARRKIDQKLVPVTVWISEKDKEFLGQEAKQQKRSLSELAAERILTRRVLKIPDLALDALYVVRNYLFLILQNLRQIARVVKEMDNRGRAGAPELARFDLIAAELHKQLDKLEDLLDQAQPRKAK